MLMEDEESRLVDERVPGANDAIEDVQVTATRNRRTCIECLVEPAQFPDGAGAKCHIRARTENTGAAGIEAIAWQHAAISYALEATAKAATLLEQDLRFGLQLHRQNQTCECRGILVINPRIHESAPPRSIDNDVIVQKG